GSGSGTPLASLRRLTLGWGHSPAGSLLGFGPAGAARGAERAGPGDGTSLGALPGTGPGRETMGACGGRRPRTSLPPILRRQRHRDPRPGHPVRRGPRLRGRPHRPRARASASGARALGGRGPTGAAGAHARGAGAGPQDSAHLGLSAGRRAGGAGAAVRRDALRRADALEAEAEVSWVGREGLEPPTFWV